MFCYSFLFGAGVGLAYTAPMVNGWKWFPEKKGLVSGAVVAGFGAGGFVFNQVGYIYSWARVFFLGLWFWFGLVWFGLASFGLGVSGALFVRFVSSKTAIFSSLPCSVILVYFSPAGQPAIRWDVLERVAFDVRIGRGESRVRLMLMRSGSSFPRKRALLAVLPSLDSEQSGSCSAWWGVDNVWVRVGVWIGCVVSETAPFYVRVQRLYPSW